MIHLRRLLRLNGEPLAVFTVTGHDTELAVGETDKDLMTLLVYDIERTIWSYGKRSGELERDDSPHRRSRNLRLIRSRGQVMGRAAVGEHGDYNTRDDENGHSNVGEMTPTPMSSGFFDEGLGRKRTGIRQVRRRLSGFLCDNHDRFYGTCSTILNNSSRP